MLLTSAATGRLQVGKTETAEGQWHCDTGDSSILPRVGHSCSMGAGRKRREFAFPCHLSLRQESLRSSFACLEQARKAAAFWGPFSGRKKGPTSANPNCCGSHFWGLFCAPKMGPNWPRRMASTWPGHGAPLRAFVSAAGHVTRRVPRATASVCLPFFPCPHGEALVCTPGLVACALHQSPLWHGACVVCTLWWP